MVVKNCNLSPCHGQGLGGTRALLPESDGGGWGGEEKRRVGVVAMVLPWCCRRSGHNYSSSKVPVRTD